MNFEVKDKVALVTGANRGIGKSILQSLIEHGAEKVYAAVRDTSTAEPLRDRYGDRVEPLLLDLASRESVDTAAQASRDVELIINNAGVLTRTRVLDADALDSLKFEFETNALGLLRMMQAYAPILRQAKQAAFVQINSVASLRTTSFLATYSASKAAAYSITQALRAELGEHGIAVLSVHPGPIATDMADQAGIAEIAEPPSIVSEAIIDALRTGQFLVFPDSFAINIGEHYEYFAEKEITGKF